MGTIGIIAGVVFFLAALAVLPSTIGLLVQAVRGKPKRRWGILLAASIAIAIASAIIGGLADAPRQEAERKESYEKAIAILEKATTDEHADPFAAIPLLVKAGNYGDAQTRLGQIRQGIKTLALKELAEARAIAKSDPTAAKAKAEKTVKVLERDGLLDDAALSELRRERDAISNAAQNLSASEPANVPQKPAPAAENARPAAKPTTRILSTERYLARSFKRSVLVSDWCSDQVARELAAEQFRIFQAEKSDALALTVYLYPPGTDTDGPANIVADGAGRGEPTIKVERWVKPDVAKDGMSLDQRRNIYMKVVAAEDRAEKEAEKRFPIENAAIPMTERQRHVQANMELKDKLTKKYTDQVVRDFKISRERLEAISAEGAENNWGEASEKPAHAHIDRARAIELCEAYAKKSAAHPSTVDFSHFMDINVDEDDPNGETTVTSSFTAKNAFNLKLKFRIRCLLNENGFVKGEIQEDSD